MLTKLSGLRQNNAGYCSSQQQLRLPISKHSFVVCITETADWRLDCISITADLKGDV